MTLEATLATLIGKRVSDKSMPGNDIDIWLEVPRRSDDAVVLSFYAPWRLVGPNSVIATSAEIPREVHDEESDRDHERRNRAARETSDFLVGRVVEGVTFDPKTRDLSLAFEGGFILQSFWVWKDGPPWTLRLYAENRRVGPGVDEAIDRPH